MESAGTLDVYSSVEEISDMSEYKADNDLERLRDILGPCVENYNCQIVDISLFKARRKNSLRLLIDKPYGGISLEECSRVNQALGRILDGQDIFQGGYALEVSSPGLERNLSTESDFRRVTGRRIRIFLKEPLKGKMEYEGIAQNTRDNTLFLNIDKAVEQISLDKISKARQVVGVFLGN